MSEQTLQDEIRALAPYLSTVTWKKVEKAADRIDELQALNQQLIEDIHLSGDTEISMMMKRGVKGLCEDKLALTRQVADLERQLAEAREDQADAKRYRWLRLQYEPISAPMGGPKAWIIDVDSHLPRGDTFDQAIDAAIAQQKVKL